ncbi:pre-mRNA-splicing factor CWC24 [Kwoniella mangroviensis CBS 10435]|uniref:Pre-mRNA-splicing factor CWC24 n=1 Tax=Kwoniella mangroviensis CBS 10435 TaxID=1331196 RepID=A0A1B9J012_9TREE|nr:pre-mRNA-splicing factor CWC24 [Kwoniella mangroviensis CBS 8507]OCF61117.1 pre-mRNA-splicing factor CWC24 [Kwoniella mangroviensis CBS 10435]OCF66718.1 pre-mRNA-splicing factor CWC24 [Kwoniella mangroviensis CBS 8507]
MASPLVQFKKGPSRRPVQSRKRSASPTADSSLPSSSTSVVRPEKKNISNPLVQGTKRRRDVNGENHDEGLGLDDLDYRADEGLTRRADELATRANDWDLEQDGGEVLKEKKLKLNEDGDLDVDDGLYRGSSNYLPTINKTRETLNAKMKTGPIKATSHVRTITLMDYQPDVCKDYKETGFCGYGDSCKFLHDRGDYLAGWQMDNLPEGQQQVIEEEDEEEEVPFACLICRQPFTNPVVTKCGHYFCMSCATKRFIKSPKCYACGAPTSGIFNTADKILAKMEARNKAKREAKGIVDEEADDDGGIEIGGGSGSEEEQEED